MNFLSPWFLLGGLAIAGPILFHLIRRAVRERMPFSSLMFLRPTPPRITRRRRLEHVFLLILRCLCLLLLATGFARPFFLRDNTLPTSTTEARQLVLLVDTSASMQREGLWDRARAVAAQYLEKTLPSDQVAVLTFDRQPRTLVSFNEWSAWSVDQRAAMAKQRLAATAPGWMATHLGLALTGAAEHFVDDSANGKSASRRELVLISDLQEGAKLDGLQGHEWPAGVKVTIEQINARRRTNAGLMISETIKKSGDTNRVSVRVTNARDSGQEKFRLGWVSDKGVSVNAPVEIYVPPGQTRSFSAPTISAKITEGQLRLTGDEESFDNVSYFAEPEPEHLTIAWFGPDSASDPAGQRYYLQRVFSGNQQVDLVSPTNSMPFATVLNQALFAVIPARLGSDDVTQVRDWLTKGKSALMVLTDPQMGPTLAALTGTSEIQVSEATGSYALLGQVDFTHPIFIPFADPRFSDFTHIHFWKHRRVEIPAGVHARALAKFDDGSPALLQLAVGKGQLLVLASGWNPADSQLAVSSKFPPMMQTMLDWSGVSAPKRFQFMTGDSIPSPVSAGGSAVVWQKPDGKKQSLAAGVAFAETDLPGIYRATAAGKERPFAVNLSLDESRTAVLAPDELARLGVPLQSSPELSLQKVQERQRHLHESELENRQKLWRWLILGVLAVTLGEIVLSGWLARRVKTVEVAA